MWTFVSIRLLPFNYQCVSRGVKCHPSDPPVSLSSAVLLLYCWVEAGMSATTSETGGGRGGYEGRTGMWVCVFVYVWGCVGSVAACWPGHPSDRVHPSTPPILHPPPGSSTPTLGPSAWLSARPGISTLISHLWRPNELRLLVHLWDPTDYQTGGRPFVNGKRWHLHCWPCCQGE